MAIRRSGKSARRSGSTPKSSEDSTTPLVVYIHGIGAQPGVEQLKREWDIALFGRDLGEQSRMARWSDILHGEQTRSARPLRRSAVEDISVDEVLADAGMTRRNRSAEEFSDRLLSALGAVAAPNAHAPIWDVTATTKGEGFRIS